MEGLPRLSLVNFELKLCPQSTHFGPKFKQYIAEAYIEDPESYNDEIHEFENLRSSALNPTSDSSGLNIMIRYFCQLKAVVYTFPMLRGQPAAVTFTWKDLYSNIDCPIADLRFEMACIMYNIGALHTLLGASEPRTSADSLNAACNHYQNAAWAFKYVEKQYPQPHGVDVCPKVMELLQEMSLAQAQECVLEKVIQDKRKPKFIGATATRAQSFYKNSLALIDSSTGSDNIHDIIGSELYNYWKIYLLFKTSYIGCIVSLYQEKPCNTNEQAMFYQQANNNIQEAHKLAEYIEPVCVTLKALDIVKNLIQITQKVTINQNDFICDEDESDMDMQEVQALAIDLEDPEVLGSDIFARLIPQGPHKASLLYSKEKFSLMLSLSKEIDETDQKLRDFADSLQFVQLNVSSSEQNENHRLNTQEMLRILNESQKSQVDIVDEVQQSLNETDELIQKEILQLNKYQKLMDTQLLSIIELEFLPEYDKYKNAHIQAEDSNKSLFKAMTLHISILKMLSQTLDVRIEDVASADRSIISRFHHMVEKIQDMQSYRETMMEHLREEILTDDITTQLLSSGPEVELRELFIQELEKHEPAVKNVLRHTMGQENMIKKLDPLHEVYVKIRGLLVEKLLKRDEFATDLETFYGTCQKLVSESRKSRGYHKELLQDVNYLLLRVRSFCQLNQKERTQMLAYQRRINYARWLRCFWPRSTRKPVNDASDFLLRSEWQSV